MQESRFLRLWKTTRTRSCSLSSSVWYVYECSRLIFSEVSGLYWNGGGSHSGVWERSSSFLKQALDQAMKSVLNRFCWPLPLQCWCMRKGKMLLLNESMVKGLSFTALRRKRTKRPELHVKSVCLVYDITFQCGMKGVNYASDGTYTGLQALEYDPQINTFQRLGLWNAENNYLLWRYEVRCVITWCINWCHGAHIFGLICDKVQIVEYIVAVSYDEFCERRNSGGW